MSLFASVVAAAVKVGASKKNPRVDDLLCGVGLGDTLFGSQFFSISNVVDSYSNLCLY